MLRFLPSFLLLSSLLPLWSFDLKLALWQKNSQNSQQQTNISCSSHGSIVGYKYTSRIARYTKMTSNVDIHFKGKAIVTINPSTYDQWSYNREGRKSRKMGEFETSWRCLLVFTKYYLVWCSSDIWLDWTGNVTSFLAEIREFIFFKSVEFKEVNFILINRIRLSSTCYR